MPEPASKSSLRSSACETLLPGGTLLVSHTLPPMTDPRPIVTAEKGRSRNLVIPDSLHDAAAIYAKKNKVRTTWKRTVNGISVGEKEGTRSLTISEVVCDALTTFLRSKGALEGADKSTSAE